MSIKINNYLTSHINTKESNWRVWRGILGVYFINIHYTHTHFFLKCFNHTNIIVKKNKGCHFNSSIKYLVVVGSILKKNTVHIYMISYHERSRTRSCSVTTTSGVTTRGLSEMEILRGKWLDTPSNTVKWFLPRLQPTQSFFHQDVNSVVDVLMQHYSQPRGETHTHILYIHTHTYRRSLLQGRKLPGIVWLMTFPVGSWGPSWHAR